MTRKKTKRGEKTATTVTTMVKGEGMWAMAEMRTWTTIDMRTEVRMKTTARGGMRDWCDRSRERGDGSDRRPTVIPPRPGQLHQRTQGALRGGTLRLLSLRFAARVRIPILPLAPRPHPYRAHPLQFLRRDAFDICFISFQHFGVRVASTCSPKCAPRRL